jgi:murein DD-endopeptidase MepM/ murein hydrolase activator NlpD
LSTKEAELASFQTKIASAQSEISQYEADIKAQENEMKKIEAEMKRREEEARKKAEAAGKTYSVSNLGNISFKWPCPSSSRITSKFGDRESPTEGASTNHKGIDIGASSGAAIVAAADGEVVISTYSYSAGNYIMIDHGGGVSTVYMHCSQLLVSKGAKVTKGQTIAKVGSTGYSTGPHLHFGIRSGGSYVNPQKYVSP